MRWPSWLRQAGEHGWTLRGLVRRPWGGRGYAVAELPLWRWQKSSVDDAIAAFVRSGRRTRVSYDDAEHLLHFAHRSALRALRERSPQYLTDAFSTLSFIDIDDVDYRDAAVQGYLAVCVAKELGLPASEAFDALARADSDLADTIVDGDEEEGGVYLDNLPNLTGERVVWTHTGPVLIGDLSDDEDPFRPDYDLVGLALRLAEALRRHGYHVSDVDILGSRRYIPEGAAPEYVAAAAGVTGRVNVEALSITLRGFSDVDIELMEVAAPEHTAVLAAAASADVHVHHGRLLVLLDGRGSARARRLVAALLPHAPQLPRSSDDA